MLQRLQRANHGGDDVEQDPTAYAQQKQHKRRPSKLRSFGRGFMKKPNDQRCPQEPELPQKEPEDTKPTEDPMQPQKPHSEPQPRRALPSLPRLQTFTRRDSERRERLLEDLPSPNERRATSRDRRRGFSASAVLRTAADCTGVVSTSTEPRVADHLSSSPVDFDLLSPVHSLALATSELPPPPIPDDLGDVDAKIPDVDVVEVNRNELQEECDRKFILNLSMHFRDESNREKFFITYAESPQKWRRVTVSLDYRDPPPGSLEETLSTLVTRRDKVFHIYEAIHESLSEIQFYDTVTNLRLETTREDDQLHVHVREDANEIVQYPAIRLFDHVESPRVRESELEFISHLSGFVYKVRCHGETVIKKEIPGPDAIEEFLYEVNALHSLLDSQFVVQLKGLVTDESGAEVRGLLIAYAEQGALVDIIYEAESTGIPWHRREKWAKQIVQGLSDIHEAGFVQGDFTLSNICVDDADDIKIIDINRRGCPVGWEPPELGRLIDSGQRIGMCISVKTDLFQLGMVLWALATNVDDPDREDRPLRPVPHDLPDYFRHMVEACLCDRPQGRPSATSLARRFPPHAGRPSTPTRPAVGFASHDVRFSDHSVSTHRSDKEYIDPKWAITLDDVNAQQQQQHRGRRTRANNADGDDGNMVEYSPFAQGQVTYVEPDHNQSHSHSHSHRDRSDPNSTSYRFGSSGGSWVVGHHRGRSPLSSQPRRQSSPFTYTRSRSPLPSSITSPSPSRSPPSRSHRRCGSDCSGEDDGKNPAAEAEADIDRGPDAFVRVPAAKHNTDPSHPRRVPLESERRPFQQQQQQQQYPTDYARGDGEVDEHDPHRAGFASPLLHVDSGFDERMVEEIECSPN